MAFYAYLLLFVGYLWPFMAIYGWEFEQFQFASKDAHLVRCRNSMAQTAARGRMKPHLGGPMMTAYLSRADTCVYRHHPRVDRRVFLVGTSLIVEICFIIPYSIYVR